MSPLMVSSMGAGSTVVTLPCCPVRAGPVGAEPLEHGHHHSAFFPFLASARSLQIGDGVVIIAVTSVRANPSTILAGLAVFGDRLGDGAFAIGVRLAAFALILIGAALIPAPVHAGEAVEASAAEPESRSGTPAGAGHPNPHETATVRPVSGRGTAPLARRRSGRGRSGGSRRA
jgi:hypothetical protein